MQWRQRRTVRLEMHDSIFRRLLEHHIALFRPSNVRPPVIHDHTARCRLLTCKPTVRLVGGIDCPRSASRHWQANFVRNPAQFCSAWRPRVGVSDHRRSQQSRRQRCRQARVGEQHAAATTNRRRSVGAPPSTFSLLRLPAPQYVLVSLDTGKPMMFGGTEEPCAYGELISSA